MFMKTIIFEKNTFYPLEVYTHLRFDVQYLKSTKDPYKVFDINKNAHLFNLAITLSDHQVTCVTRDIFQSKSSKMPSSVKYKHKLL
jgi:hypothetical protein